MSSTGGSYNPPPTNTGGGTGGTDDQQIALNEQDQLVLEDGGTPIDLSDFRNMDIVDVFGNVIS